MPIDIGSGATDRANGITPNFTVVDFANPVSVAGVLDTFELWFGVTGGGVKVGTFSGSETTFTNRDSETIGSVTSGSKQTFTGKTCDAVAGDFIGIYVSSGSIDNDITGGTGIVIHVGDLFGAGEDTGYSELPTYAISAYGTGVANTVVTTQAVSGITTSGCTGNGNITAVGDGITRRGFCYMFGITGDPTTANSTVYEDDAWGTGAYTLAITGLDPGTPYRVRAYVVATNTYYGATVQLNTTGSFKPQIMTF
jgi:hypothetical protein